MSESKPNKGDILIVDDQLTNLKILSTILAGQGYQVRSADSGKLALEAAWKSPPDLILLDIMMPGMNGYEVCERLKADEQTRDIPVIFVTVLDKAKDKVKAFTAGGVDYVTKPFRVKEVLARVKAQMALRVMQKQLKEQNTQLEREITERRRAEETLQRRNRELAMLHHASRAFSSTLDLDQVLATVLEEVRRLMDAVACSVWLLEPPSPCEGEGRGGGLVCRQVTGPQSELVRGWRLAPGIGLAGWAIRHGESLIVPDTQSDSRHFKGVDQKTGLELRSILSVPLRVKEDVIGVLQVVDTEVDSFDKGDLALLEPLAASAAIAIENARLYEQAQQEISERKRAEETLRESERFLQDTFNSIQDGISVLDRDLNVLRTNVGMEEMYKEQMPLVGKKCYQVYQTLESPCPGCPSLRAIETGTMHTEIVPYLSAEELTGWIDLSAYPLKDAEDQVISVIEYVKDITGRKRAEDALEQRAAQLALLNDIGGKIAGVLDLDSVLERAARLVQESFGYHHVALFTLDRERGELVMRARSGDFSHLFPPDHRLKLDQGVVGWVARHGERLLANDVDADPRYVNLYPGVVPTRSELSVPIQVSGEIVGVLDVQSPQLDAFDESDATVMETLANQVAAAIENARLYEAIAQELAERKRAEAIAWEWKSRYDVATLASGHLLYDWNSETNEVTYGGNVEKILGYTLEEMEGGLDRWLELIHPKDQSYFDEVIKQLIATNEPAHLEYRVRRKDGKYIIVEDDGRFITDAQGNTVQMVGFVKDITGRKRAEEERTRLLAQIQEQAQQLQQVMNTVPEGVLLLGVGGQVILANPVAEGDLAVLAGAKVGDTLTHLGGRPLAELLARPAGGAWHDVDIDGPPSRYFEIIARSIKPARRLESGCSPSGT